MLAYILRRLLLIIPTLFGILLINFIIIQAAPGGPVEQMIAKLEGFDAAAGGATGRISGGGSEVAASSSSYRGTQGLDLRTFEVRAKPLAAEPGLRPGMSVIVRP